MRILGTEPSSVILSQTKKKTDGVINPPNYYFSQFYHGKF